MDAAAAQALVQQADENATVPWRGEYSQWIHALIYPGYHTIRNTRLIGCGVKDTNNLTHINTF